MNRLMDSKPKLLAIFIFTLFTISQCKIIPTELMFHPRQNGHEYLEIYNTDTQSVDLTNWSFKKGINYTFPSGSIIPGQGYLVLAENRRHIERAYPNLDPSKIIGNFGGKISSKGEELTLVNAQGTQVFSFKFDDKWYPLADGYGSSIELVCEDADLVSPSSWRASALPSSNDPFKEFSGTPGTRGNWYSCPAPVTSYLTKKIYFSEVNYKPKDEKSRVDFHEYIELYNDETTPVSLDNYRVISRSGFNSIQYIFPVGSTIAAKSYILLSKNKLMLNQVYKFSSSIYSAIFGDYLGELRGSDEIALVDSNGQLVEELAYGNDFPWPVGANDFGGEQYKGLSLERVSFSVASSKKYNWVAAVPTPGAQNSAKRDQPLPVVTELNIVQGSNNKSHQLVPDQPIFVKISVGPKSVASKLSIEYFIDLLDSTTEEHTTTVMTLNSANSNNNDEYSFTFTSGLKENTIIKYRFIADYAGASNKVISPRDNDPFQWFSFFVSPVIDTPTDIYHLFINSANWGQLWKNLRSDLYMGWGLYEDLPGSCCNINPLWNNDVDAQLGWKGEAYDVKVKYQGSPYNRARGTTTTKWNVTGPTDPTPMPVLSWKIELPKWAKIDSKSELYLLKPRDHGCSFLTTDMMYQLAEQLGLPAPRIKFSRLHINGGYYLYAMDVQYYDKELLEDEIVDIYDDKCTHQASEEVGFMYKAHGFGCEGLVAPANEQFLYPITNCGGTGKNFSTLERLANTYDLETHKSWGNHESIYNITDYLNGINALTFTESNAVARKWFADNFDLNHMLSYISLVNWGGAWDDLLGNHMIYQRITDGKWTMTPWDMDSFFGETQPCEDPTCSIYLGEEGAPVGEYQLPGGHNVLKDAFIKTYRTELQQRFKLLARTVLSVDNVAKTLASSNAKLNYTEYQMSILAIPMEATCVSSINSWHVQRNAYVNTLLSNVIVPETAKLSVCPDKPNATFTQTSAIFQSTPGQPYRPFMTSTTPGAISLSWDAPNSNGVAISSYKLERRSKDGSDFVTAYDGPNRSFTDSNLDSATTYVYRLQATNTKGVSPYSDEVSFIPGQFGEVPTEPIASSVNKIIISISTILIAVLLL